MEPTMSLTNKEKAFVREYVKDFNGAQAAIRAGYAPRSANVTGSQKLAKPSIRDAIKELTDAARTEAIMTIQDLQEFWSSMTQKADRDGDKLRASELLGRSLSAFTENLNLNQKGNPRDWTDEELERYLAERNLLD